MSWLVPILLLIATTGSAAENSSITSSAQQSTESVEICPFDSNAYGNPCTHADCTVNAESVQCTNVISGYCQQRNRTKSMDPGCFDIFSFVDYDIPSVTTVYPAAFTTTGLPVQKTTTLGPHTLPHRRCNNTGVRHFDYKSCREFERHSSGDNNICMQPLVCLLQILQLQTLLFGNVSAATATTVSSTTATRLVIVFDIKFATTVASGTRNVQ